MRYATEAYANETGYGYANGKKPMRLYQKHRLQRQQRRRAALMLFGLPFIGFLAGILVMSAITDFRAKNGFNDYGRELKYAAYTVQHGDTLWDIASDMAAINPEFKDVRQYLYLLQKTNHVYSENLKAGDTIFIPYYAAPADDNGLEKDMLSIYAKYDINYSRWVDLIKGMQ